MQSKTPEKRKSSARIIPSPSPKKHKTAFREWASSVDTNKTKRASQLLGSTFPKEAKNRPTLFDDDALITFIVGAEDNTETFMVSKKLACFYSRVLNTAFNGDSVENRTQTYRIVDTTLRAFQMLNGWLYNEALNTKQLNPVPDMDLDSLDYREEDNALAELWVLAEKLSMPTLQNAAIKAITEIAIEHNCAPETTFDYVYKNTRDEESPLRRLLVRQCIEYTDPSLFVENKDQFPKDLLAEIAAYALLNMAPIETTIEAEE
ncbi:hypothetical protein BDZ45DRAFT_695919 [Acephala macrosclerotiorum]|nr:hypothetical protein BDZ45DRAFT_695919 [Acephala macrosclerotiorum]